MTRARCTVAFLLLSGLAHGQSTLLVPEQHATVQSAIDAAVDGDTVLVSPGTYVENISFAGKDIEVRSRFGARVTVLDGAHNASVVRFVGGEGPLAVLDGFTVRNGESGNGGGIECTGSSPTLRNCVVRDNAAIGDGGGIYLGASAALVLNCLVHDNEVGFYGSGIYATGGSPTILHCTVVGNHSYDYWYLSVGISSDSGSTFVGNTISRANTCDPLGPHPADVYIEVPGSVVHSNFGGAPASDGNLDVAPAFVAPRDFHLLAASPCRDAGLAGLPGAPATDFEGDPRAAGAAPDIGADEHSLHLWYTGVATPGAMIELHIVGAAPASSCTAWLSGALAPTPVPTPYGLFYLADRRALLFSNLQVPADGLLEVPYTVPAGVPTAITLYAQALAGPALTNFEAIRVP